MWRKLTYEVEEQIIIKYNLLFFFGGGGFNINATFSFICVHELIVEDKIMVIRKKHYRKWNHTYIPRGITFIPVRVTQGNVPYKYLFPDFNYYIL